MTVTGAASDTSATTTPADGGRRTTGWRPVRRPAWRVALIWLVAAWFIPVATHLLGVDWLLPPLVVLLTAGLLRGGRTLLDRLMLAVAVLLGAVCAAGLLFTVWPFGMAPVPVAGVAITVLGAISVWTGRAPRLPSPALADGLTVLPALGVLGYVAIPYLRADGTGRLAMLLGADDNARHVAIFDTLRRIGGYAYWHTPAQVPDMFDQLRYYPSGWHLTAAVLDGFVRSSTEPAAMTSVVDHHIGFLLAGYGLFALAVMWAAQWIAGPLLTFWRRLPLFAFLGVQLIYGELPVLTILGFVSEIFGLTLFVLLVAVIARPVRGIREQIVLLATLLVGIGFGYELLLPPAGFAALIWLVRHRRQVAGRWRFVLVTGAVAGPLAVLPMALGALYGGHADLIRAPGGVFGVSRALLLAVALVLLAALVTPAGRRLRVWRGYAWTVGAMLVLPAAIEAYRVLSGTAATYYLEKALHAVLATLFVGLGALVLLLPRPQRAARLTSRRALYRALIPVLITGAVVSMAGIVSQDTPYQPGRVERLNRMWHSGQASASNRPLAATIVDLNRRFPARGDTVTLVLVGPEKDYSTYTETLFLSMLQRTSGLTQELLYRSTGFNTEPGELGAILSRNPHPIRVIVVTAAADDQLTRIRQQYPGLTLDVQRIYPGATGP